MTSRDHQRCCEAVRSAVLATAWLLVVGGLALRLSVQWFLYGNLLTKILVTLWFSSCSYIVWSMGIPGMKVFGASGTDPYGYGEALALAPKTFPWTRCVTMLNLLVLLCPTLLNSVIDRRFCTLGDPFPRDLGPNELRANVNLLWQFRQNPLTTFWVILQSLHTNKQNDCNIFWLCLR